ncbi:PPC domain-containing DNA-binding protein [Pseudogemmobacter bohemicus]|uniref:PPC domain-containing DNA-binding protein n=1 Tax=Pseudogemmobacter bohemicus TaxID=2250708 RepID=UPI0013003B1F|nr:PPC domain-containing DNA-binding protein [Pseudogemmobacter bohemicus]
MTNPSQGQASAADLPSTFGLSQGGFGAFACRLPPAADLTDALRAFQRQSGVAAISVVPCACRLTRALIRHANRPEGTLCQGHFEITSLTGTVDPGGEHVHPTITDGEGCAFGRHLLPDSAVCTTAGITVRCRLTSSSPASPALCPAMTSWSSIPLKLNPEEPIHDILTFLSPQPGACGHRDRAEHRAWPGRVVSETADRF